MAAPARQPSLDPFTSSSGLPPGQFPFPAGESSRKGSGPVRGHLRRGSTASSISSIGGALDSSLTLRTSSVAESSQNAISTLLQPPIVRTGLMPHTSAPASSAHRAPSSKDIPPVTLTNIPHVEPSEFDTYLSQVGSLYDAFQRAKGEVEAGSDRPNRREGDSSIRKSRNDAPSTPRSGLLSGSVPPSPVATPSTPVRSSGAYKRSAMMPTPLTTIPSVYFAQDFHLENPRTFDVVSERSEVVQPPSATEEKGDLNGSLTGPGGSGRKALATNAILQEKLSWYMDTVEMHLISSISTASTSFFAALGSLRDLHSEAADSVLRIKRLRDDLRGLDEDMAVRGLKVVGMRRRRENVRKLGEAIDQLKRVVEEVARCGSLADNGEIEDALDGVEAVERFMAGEEGPLSRPDEAILDLRKVKALYGASDELNLLRNRVGKGFETRFLNALLGDLRQHVNSVPPRETIQRWSHSMQRGRGEHKRKPSSFPAYLSLQGDLRTRLHSILAGLGRSQHTMSAAATFREAVFREIKSSIRRHLPSSNEDDVESMTSVSTRGGGRHRNAQEKSLILARNLRALDPADAEELLVKIFSSVGEGLRRLSVHLKLLLDITSGLSSPPLGTSRSISSPQIPPLDAFLQEKRSPQAPAITIGFQEQINQALDMSSLLGQAVDIAQDQITKILKVRSEQIAHLPLSRFLRYFTLSRLFADECEQISGRGGTMLKGLVNSHIKDFVTAFAESERQTLAQTMEADKWEAKDFGDEANQSLSRIAEGSTKDAEEWTQQSRAWDSLEDVTKSLANGTSSPSSNVDAAATSANTNPTKIRQAQLDSQKFILPLSALALLHNLETYGSLIANIPSIASDVALKLLDHLKLFNSRSYQLILGAGATKSAGLKNITTKHLALASQSLSFVIALVPHLREFVRRHLPTGTGTGTGVGADVLAEFDKVKRLYYEHQAQIHEKLVDIMSGRAATHVNAMRRIDWDDVAPPAAKEAGADAISPYMDTLTRETGTLHRVLSKHLPPETVLAIMGPVFTSYRTQWGKAFGDVEVRTPEGKERLLRDARHLKAKLDKLEGADGVGSLLVGVVEGRELPDDAGAIADGDEAGDAGVESDASAVAATTAAGAENGEKRSSGETAKGADGGGT